MAADIVAKNLGGNGLCYYWSTVYGMFAVIFIGWWWLLVNKVQWSLSQALVGKKVQVRC